MLNIDKLPISYLLLTLLLIANFLVNLTIVITKHPFQTCFVNFPIAFVVNNNLIQLAAYPYLAQLIVSAIWPFFALLFVYGPIVSTMFAYILCCLWLLQLGAILGANAGGFVLLFMNDCQPTWLPYPIALFGSLLSLMACIKVIQIAKWYFGTIYKIAKQQYELNDELQLCKTFVFYFFFNYNIIPNYANYRLSAPDYSSPGSLNETTPLVQENITVEKQESYTSGDNEKEEDAVSAVAKLTLRLNTFSAPWITHWQHAYKVSLLPLPWESTIVQSIAAIISNTNHELDKNQPLKEQSISLINKDPSIHWPQIQVTEVFLIRNNGLWNTYRTRRQLLKEKIEQTFHSNNNNRFSSGITFNQVATQHPIQIVDKSINECWLFHGGNQKKKVCRNIRTVGLSDQYSSASANLALGKGVYFSDSFAKSNNYVTCKNCNNPKCSALNCAYVDEDKATRKALQRLSVENQTPTQPMEYPAKKGELVMYLCLVTLGNVKKAYSPDRTSNLAKLQETHQDAVWAVPKNICKQHNHSSTFYFAEFCQPSRELCIPIFEIHYTRSKS